MMSQPCPHCEENKHRDAGYICTCQDKADYPRWSRKVYAKRVWPWNGYDDNCGVVHCYPASSSGWLDTIDGFTIIQRGEGIIEHLNGTFEVVSEEEYKEMGWKEME